MTIWPIIDQLNQFTHFVRDACNRTFRPNASDYTLARKILGNDFISPEEIALAYGLVYTKKQLIALRRRLPNKAKLKAIGDAGMLLVAEPPIAMSTFDIYALNTNYIHLLYFDNKNLCEKFAHDDMVEALGWIALRKRPVRNWTNDGKLPSDIKYIPNAAETAWVLTTYRAVRNKYRLDQISMRTSSIGSAGYHVIINVCFKLYIWPGSYNGEYQNCIATASAQKF